MAKLLLLCLGLLIRLLWRSASSLSLWLPVTSSCSGVPAVLPRFLGRGSPTTNTSEPLRGNRTHSRRAPVRFWRSSRLPG
ncbi:unnamed protein product, partial [Symbiodinium necroappetens]